MPHTRIHHHAHASVCPSVRNPLIITVAPIRPLWFYQRRAKVLTSNDNSGCFTDRGFIIMSMLNQ